MAGDATTGDGHCGSCRHWRHTFRSEFAPDLKRWAMADQTEAHEKAGTIEVRTCAPGWGYCRAADQSDIVSIEADGGGSLATHAGFGCVLFSRMTAQEDQVETERFANSPPRQPLPRSHVISTDGGAVVTVGDYDDVDAMLAAKGWRRTEGITTSGGHVHIIAESQPERDRNGLERRAVARVAGRSVAEAVAALEAAIDSDARSP